MNARFTVCKAASKSKSDFESDELHRCTFVTRAYRSRYFTFELISQKGVAKLSRGYRHAIDIVDITV